TESATRATVRDGSAVRARSPAESRLPWQANVASRRCVNPPARQSWSNRAAAASVSDWRPTSTAFRTRAECGSAPHPAGSPPLAIGSPSRLHCGLTPGYLCGQPGGRRGSENRAAPGTLSVSTATAPRRLRWEGRELHGQGLPVGSSLFRPLQEHGKDGGDYT